MCSTQLRFNEVLISSSISQPSTNDIIAQQAELPPLRHKEQQTASAVGLRLQQYVSSNIQPETMIGKLHTSATDQQENKRLRPLQNTVEMLFGDWEESHQIKFHISSSLVIGDLGKSFKHLEEVHFSKCKETPIQSLQATCGSREYGRRSRKHYSTQT